MVDLSLLDNTILSVDSYKSSHYLLYPEDTAVSYAYIESRGGDGDATVFVGLQMFLKRYLMKQITHAMVNEAKEVLELHGLPFNEAGWRRIVDKHDGHLPLRIKAVKEGSIIPKKNVLLTIESTDPQLAWLPMYFETALLRAIWYPTNVATLSYQAKKILRKYLQLSSDLTNEAFDMKLAYVLHDFGSRGVSSKESSEIGGLGHLVNFMGTDTIGALLSARLFYGESMAGYSIPASEHSTVTAWGRDHELDFYRHQLKTLGKPGKLFASVIDSYDADSAIRDKWGSLKDDLITSGAKLILRPDSGEPTETVPRLLDIAGETFGYTVNNKSYKLLPPYIGMIQGDGIDINSLPKICEAILAAGWSLENMAFGMGGGLLQQHNRDTHKFAQKLSAVYRRGGAWEDKTPIAGEWQDVYKSPKDDPGKASKRGRFGLYLRNRTYETGEIGQGHDLLEIVFENGHLLRDQTFAELRRLANQF